MNIFKPWMFISNPKKLEKKRNIATHRTYDDIEIVEEEDLTKSSMIFDKVTVFFLYFLICICALSLCLGITLLILENVHYKDVLAIFSSSLTYLVGYFFGTNKKR